jgi:ribosome biogenesis GTPase
MKDKTSLFSGQSGTGKSSLINAMSQFQLPIGNVIDKTRKGAHTTTSAQLLPLAFGGWCIDTPGIRSFGLWRLDKDEVEGFFPEILKFSLNCKYPSCRHLQEPECAVKQAVEQGQISPLRYESYQKLITDEDWDLPY